ncbi:porin [Azovibrio restrictus]|uniref:porin n=1 Tax=Azovibrio restrictus TaxID=146938 RepID=UPI0026EC63D3|nr:porin [Azovibrio restrictus]MDD3481875.1 porin [Azovibrio restrictus]
MQKKLIALAVAALASGAAFAQSNVQIYGAIDMGYSYRSDAMLKGVKSQSAIDSGLSDGNRLGFKGTEDLGNGVKALFTLEMGFLADTGKHDAFAGGDMFSRQAMLGLTGGFGTVVAGRLLNPQYSFLTAIDPFGEGTVGTYLNVVGNDVGSDLVVIPRLSNAVAYVSPSFSGFNVTAAYASNGVAADQVGGSDNNNRVYGILPRYTNGPLDVGLSYHRINFADATGLDDLRNWTVGGTYDLGMVKLAAFYADTRIDDATAGVADLKVKNWMVGATVPFGKHAVKLSYNTSKAKQDDLSGDSSQWAVGYNYSLSNRTSLYAAYATIDNDRSGSKTLVRGNVLNDASNSGGSYGQGYRDGLQFGMMHTF